MPHAATVRRHLPAPPERVWRAISSEEFAAWFWPPRFASQVTIDARAGGTFHVRSAAMGMGASGSFEAVEPPRRLVASWRWDGEDGETRVTIEVTPDGAGTAVTVVHDGFPDDASAAAHATGWSDCLDRLPAHLLAG